MSTNPSTDHASVSPGPHPSDDSVAALFCECGGLLSPKFGWACQACGNSPGQPAVGISITHEQEERTLNVISETFYPGPKTSVRCPACDHGEAYYRLQQTRSADESETRFFTCSNCEHEWQDRD